MYFDSDSATGASCLQQSQCSLDGLADGLGKRLTSAAAKCQVKPDADSLKSLLETLAQHFEILRTKAQYDDAGVMWQVVEPNANVMVQTLDFADSEQAFAALANAPIVASMQLTIINLPNEQYALHLAVPSLLVDDFSVSLLLSKLLFATVSGNQAVIDSLDPEPIQYAELAPWLDDFLLDESLADARAFWRDAAQLPWWTLDNGLARVKPVAEQGFGHLTLPLGAIAEQLSRQAEMAGASLADMVFAALRLTMGNGEGEGVGAGQWGRVLDSRADEALVDAIGPLSRALPLKTLPAQSLSEALANECQVKEQALDYIECFFREGALADKPFQLTFSAVEFDKSCGTMLALDWSGEPGKLRFTLIEQGSDSLLSVSFDSSWIAPQVLQGYLERLYLCLSGAPSPRLESVVVTSDFSGFEAPCFTAHKQANDNLVVEQGGHSATLGEIDKKANRIARALMAKGIGKGQLVGLMLERGVDFVVAMLAIARTGAAYLPIDTALPQERVSSMLETAQSQWVIAEGQLTIGNCQSLTLDELDSPDLADSWPEVELGPNDLAYVLFTSGSTGKPKGVAISHGALFNHMRWMNQSFDFSAEDVFCQRTSASFDASVWEFYSPLMCGAKVVIADKSANYELATLAQLISDHQVSRLQMVPAQLQVFLNHTDAALELKTLFLGGEALSTALAKSAQLRFDCEVVNLYGPSECCIDACFARFDDQIQQDFVPIGQAIDNVSAQVVKSDGSLAATGECGELYLAGNCVFDGYYNNSELTAQAVVQNGQTRWYKTGDWVRILSDGSLYYLERLDHQVKINGLRIELGEIEVCISELEQVQSAVVIARQDQGNSKGLVAYVVSDSEEEALFAQIKAKLAANLPDYMQPANYVLLDKLPLLSNGKVDRKALPAPELKVSRVAPQSDTEKALVAIWSELLAIEAEQLSTTSGFFAMGGHSLLAVQLVSDIRDTLGVEILISDVFELGDIKTIAAHIDNLNDHIVRPKIEPRTTGNAPVPCSFAQQRLWFLDALDGGSSRYNMPLALKVEGQFKPELAEQAMNLIIERHEVLRTRYVQPDEQPLQVIDQNVQFTLHRYHHQGSEAQLQQWIAEHHAQHFDLSADLMVRASYIEYEHYGILLFNMHHIASDGWSMDVLVKEFAEIYQALSQGQTPDLAPLPVQYADYALWQRNWLQGEVLDSQKHYWQQQLKDCPVVHSLSLDYPRPAQKGAQGKMYQGVVDKDTAVALQSMATQHRLTPFMLLHGAFALLLSRHGNSNDIVLGTPVANRLQSELEPLIGFFVNTLVLRVATDKASLSDYLAHVRQVHLDAQSHQDIGFEYLLDLCQIERSVRHTPLFQVLFSTTMDDDSKKLQLPDISLSNIARDQVAAKFDLQLNAVVTGGEIYLQWTYDTELFKPATIERFNAHFCELLHSLLAANSEAKPLELNLYAEQEQQRLAAGLFGPVRQLSVANVNSLIEHGAAINPQAIALSHNEQSLSFAQMLDKRDRLAAQLQSMGINKGDLIGLCLPRSIGQSVAMLACLKLGCGYVPLMTNLPSERLKTIADDAAVKLLLCDESSQSLTLELCHSAPRQALSLQALMSDNWLEAHAGAELICDMPTSDDVAYVLHTSGSTGTPKGVMVHHGALVNYLSDAIEDYWHKGLSFAVVSSPLQFDATLVTQLLPLCAGGQVVLLDDDDSLLLKLHQQLFNSDKAGLFKLTPAHLDALAQLDGGKTISQCHHTLVIGGEALSYEQLTPWFERLPHGRFFNQYGPTETTVACSRYLIETDSQLSGAVPIGQAIANTQFLLLDPQGQPVPDGAAGEIYIGGQGVSLGYLNQPELNAQSFVTTAFSEQRFYRSGDLVRHLGDGRLSFIARIDGQLQLNGYRIEPGEIEAALKAQSSVAIAHVAMLNKVLVAYCVMAQGKVLEQASLRQALAQRLPEYMVPALFVALDEMPLNANGKVDGRALPKPLAEVSIEKVQPSNEREARLRAIWAQVLKRDEQSIGVDDNFFMLGGDSILSILVVSKAANEGMFFSVKALFNAQTIKALAKVVQDENHTQAEQGVLTGTMALMPVQQLFFSDLTDWHHYNQAVMLHAPDDLDQAKLKQMVEALVAQHDALRLAFEPQQPARFVDVDINELVCSDLDCTDVKAFADSVQASLAPGRGVVFKAALIQSGAFSGKRLLLVAHHLVVDGVSWRIVIDDIKTLYRGLTEGKALAGLLGVKTSSYRQWSDYLKDQAQQMATQLPLWRSICAADYAKLQDHNGEFAAKAGTRRVDFQLTESQTLQLLEQCNQSYRSNINELLLSALLLSWQQVTGEGKVRLNLESHGREALSDSIDLSRTVGWFTSIYPVSLYMQGEGDIADAIYSVKEQLRQIPDNGLGFGVLKYLAGAELEQNEACELVFNYLGQFDQLNEAQGTFNPAAESTGRAVSSKRANRYALTLNGMVASGKLGFALEYDAQRYDEQLIAQFMTQFAAALGAVIDHCVATEQGRFGPSDFPEAKLDGKTLDAICQQANANQLQIADLYPATSMQQGLLFHNLLQQGGYVTQLVMDFAGLNVANMQQAWQQVVEQHDIFRSGFVAFDTDVPHQMVVESATVPWRNVDMLDATDVELSELASAERLEPFDLNKPPLMRFCAANLAGGKTRIIWSHHHALLDGWSLPLVFAEVSKRYEALQNGQSLNLAKTHAGREYANWLGKQDMAAAKRYWQSQVELIENATPLPLVSNRLADSALNNHRHTLRFDSVQSEALQSLARSCGTTINIVVQAAWAMLLSRFSDEQQVCFGAVTSGRPADLASMEQMIGAFINTQPVCTSVHDDYRLSDWLGQLHQGLIERESYSYFPLQQILSLPGCPDSPFDSLLVFENYPVDEGISEQAQNAALRVTDINSFEQTNYGMTLHARFDGMLSMTLVVKAALLASPKVEQLLSTLGHLIEMMAAEPQQRLGELSLISPAERERLVYQCNQTEVELPQQRLIHQLFELQCLQTPNATAVSYHSDSLSYEALNHKANQIAHLLLERGATQGQRVGVCLERGANLLPALLAVMKVGGAYVPLDKDYPKQRLDYLVKDSDIALVLTERALLGLLTLSNEVQALCLDELPQHLNTCNPDIAIEPDALAYIIYTSGSTGLPKGVMISHANATAMLDWAMRAYSAVELAKVLASTSVNFDLSVYELFLPLCVGGEVVLVGNILELLQKPLDVTLINTVPSAMAELINAQAVPESVLCINLAGEALSAELAQGVYGKTKAQKLYNLYGPSEDTTYSLYSLVANDGSAPTIGVPVDNTRAYVLDSSQRLVPFGAIGELYLAGAGVVKGYLNRPEMTKERFLPSPFVPGDTMYRTGDLVRYLDDGQLMFIGRADAQVKLRGYRIELGEIEQALLASGLLHQAVVLVCDDKLYAFVVAKAPHNELHQQLTQALSAQLPSYMVPGEFIDLETMPLTPNGKIDKQALPKLIVKQSRVGSAALVDVHQQYLAELWSQLLDCPIAELSAESHFFELGGHSLTAVRLLAQLRQYSGAQIDLKALFERPVLRAMAELLKAPGQSAKALTPVAQPRSDMMPLSFAQQRLWFIDSMQGQSPEYNLPLVIEVTGRFSLDLAQQALGKIIERHEILRSVYLQHDGQPMQQVRPADGFSIDYVDMHGATAHDLEQAVLAAQMAPFSLIDGPILKVSYFDLAAQGEQASHGMVVFNVHHIAADGWSMGILVREFAAIYQALAQGESPNLPTLALQYIDYALWQQQYLQGEVLSKQLGYWQRQLADLPVVHSLPLKQVRPKDKGLAGDVLGIQLDSELLKQLQSLASSHGMTLFMLLHGALSLTLGRFGNRSDVVIGTAVANRTMSEFESLIGCFVNTLVLRVNTKHNDLSDYLAHVKTVNFDAQANQDVPFEQLVELLQPERSTAHTPLFQVLFNLDNNDSSALTLPEVSFDVRGATRVMAKYDLSVNAMYNGQGLYVGFSYDVALFGRELIADMSNMLTTLLRAMVSGKAEQLAPAAFYDNDTLAQLKLGLQGEVCALPHESFIAWFDKQCVQTPDSTAVSLGDVAFDYQTLNLKANRLADLLIEAGIEAGERVGIAMERSVEQLVSVLGVLKVGASYVPLSPEYPKARLSQMIEDSDVAQVLVSSTSAATVPLAGIDFVVIDECSDEDWLEGYSDDAPEVELGAGSEAYVLYTSGSTGKPKGVMVPNRALVNYLCFAKANYMQGDVTGAVVSSPLYFDATLTSLLTPLCCGGEVKLLADDDGVLEQVYDLLMGDKALLFKITPAHLEGLLQLKDSHNTHHIEHCIVVGGEALPPATLKRWQGILPQARFINEYGPTETVVGCSIYQANVEDDWSLGVPVGKPIQNTGLWLLDEDLNPVPQGSMGELYIGGLGVTDGYVGQSELTDERFIANPFGEGRLYRSGDLMRVMPDGQLQYCGRSDHQIKLRGYRIEPGEIAHVLNGCEGCNQALVMVKDELLVAYVAGDVTESALRQAAEQQLPSFMQPQVYVVLEVMPLTDNGKIDTKALPGIDGRSTQAVYQAPRNETEQQLVAIWAELLKLDSDKLSVDADFFALGGHSLLAVRLSAQIRAVFGKELSIKALFDTTTIAKQALLIAQSDSAALLPPLLAHNTPAGEGIELSYAQQRLWFIDKMDEGSSQYNMPMALRFKGQLQEELVEGAINAIIERHHILRTVYIEQDGAALQYVKSRKLTLERLDVRELPVQEQQAAINRVLQLGSAKPFDLSNDLMVRGSFVRTADDSGVLLFTMHHIASDGWSMALMLKEFVAAYKALSVQGDWQVAPLPLQYHDFAIWQKAALSGEFLQSQLAYWQQQLAEVEPVHGIALDNPRPEVKASSGDTVLSHIDSDTAKALEQLAGAHQMTPFMLLHGALSLLVARHSGRDDVVIGTVVANRTEAELAQLIGFFINTLALRVNTDYQDMAAYLAHVREVNLDAQAHQALPFELLVEQLNLPRSAQHTPLVQILFAMNTVDNDISALDEVSFETMGGIKPAAKFDLDIIARQTDEGITFSWIFDTSIWRKQRIEIFAEHLNRLLKAMLNAQNAAPRALEMLTSKQREQALYGFNQTQFAFAQDTLVHELIEAWAVKTPDALAARCGENTLSYQQLNNRANALAKVLRDKGVKPDSLVGVCLSRTINLPVALLAVLKSGGAYIAMDPALPDDRLNGILAQANALLVLCDEQLSNGVNAAERMSLSQSGFDDSAQLANLPRLSAMDSDKLAYAIFTSGSSGKPKGVLLNHRGLVNLVLDGQKRFALDNNSVLLQVSAFGFDAATWDWALGLCSGACVNIADEQVRMSAALLTDYVQQYPPSYGFIPPALLDILPTEPFAAVKTIVTGGEAVSVKTAKRWAQGRRFFNAYGPTENTVVATISEVSVDSQALDIGLPIHNVEALVLDKFNQLVPLGCVGELCVGGIGLARGYLANEALTEQAFIAHPFVQDANKRLYRTGDLVKRLANGHLAFVGRADKQVKIRGYRIEVQEIEALLLAQSGVESAVVTVKTSAAGRQMLLAYVVLNDDAAIDGEGLKAQLATKLPQYMVPQSVMVLPSLPLTANGKVALEQLPLPQQDAVQSHARPQNDKEQQLLEIWAQLLKLGRDDFGVEDNFFELGGDSILSIQVVSRAAAKGIHFSVKDLFDAQTIRQLVALEGKAVAVSAIQSEVTGELELLPVQQMFFEDLNDWHHFNQSVMLQTPSDFDFAALKAVVEKLLAHHDALRLQFEVTDIGVKTSHLAPSVIDVDKICQQVSWPEQGVSEFAASCQTELAPSRGEMVKVVYITPPSSGGTGRMLIVIHHLVVDGVSWRILLEDLQNLYRQKLVGQPLSLPAKTSAFAQWSHFLKARANSDELAPSRAIFTQMAEKAPQTIRESALNRSAERNGSGYHSLSFRLDEATTKQLLGPANRAYRTGINELLLSALLLAVKRAFGNDSLSLALEGHGREALSQGLDLSRTVGWFTTIYPLNLRVNDNDIAALICAVKDDYRLVADKGIDYGLLRYLAEPRLAATQSPELAFNYLGQFDQVLEQDSYFVGAAEGRGAEISPKRQMPFALTLNSMVSGGTLNLTLTFDQSQYHMAAMQALVDGYQQGLIELTEHCMQTQWGRLSYSDFPLMQMSPELFSELVDVNDSNIEDIYPASAMQQGLLFHSMMEQGSYTTLQVIVLRDLDVARFKQAWSEVIARHSIFRTAFIGAEQGNMHQLVRKSVNFDWQLLDYADMDTQQQREALDALRIAEKSQGFEHQVAPLMRCTLVALGHSRHQLIWSHHHALMDGWSLPLVFAEVIECYRAALQNQAPQLTKAVPYSHYARWLAQQNESAALSYWRELLADVSHSTPLPLAHLQEKTAQPQTTNHIEVMRYDAGLTEQVSQFAQRCKVTVNVIIQAVWALTLARYSASEQVVFGAVSSGRPAQLDGVERLVGLFINTLPVPVAIDEQQQVGDFVAHLHQQVASSEQYGFVPLSSIMAQSGFNQSLFDSLLVFENYPFDESVGDKAGQAALSVESVDGFTGTNYGLTVTAYLINTLVVKIDGKAGLYQPSKLEAIAKGFTHLLKALVADKHTELKDISLPVALPESKPQPFSDDMSLMALYEAQVKTKAQATALVFDDIELSYEALDCQVNQMAHLLVQEYGIANRSRVAICTERHHLRVIAILAVLKLGACYVPISEELPKARIDYMLEQAQPQLILTDNNSAANYHGATCPMLAVDDASLQARMAQMPSDAPVAVQGEVAHIIFTSGSTGKPKGVEGSYRATFNRVQWMLQRWPFEAGESVLHITSMAFIRGVWELLVPLCGGATLVLCDRETVKATDRLWDKICEHNISRIVTAPSLMSALIEVDSTSVCPIKHWFVSGEPLKQSEASKLLNAHSNVALYNLYGSTEVMSDVSCYQVNQQDTQLYVPIGEAIDNTTVEVCSLGGKALPHGAIGELVVKGAALAKGYLNGANGGFIANDGQNAYHTGDFGFVDSNGQLHCLGRIDNQVKIRGHRIEPGEIEAALMAIEGVKLACVKTFGKGESLHLAAYVVDDNPREALYRERLSAQLPAYMVPNAFVVLEQMPLKPNGKIDKQALGQIITQSHGRAPQGEVEQTIAALWSALLNTELKHIDAQSDFFTIGGHSLLAIRLANELKQTFGLDNSGLGVREVFAYPVLEHMATQIEQLRHLKMQQDTQAALAQVDELEQGEI